MFEAQEVADWDDEVSEDVANKEWEVGPEHSQLTLGQLFDGARKAIDDFFEGRQMYCGGKIVRRYLEDAKLLAMVMGLEMDPAVQIIHDAIEVEYKAERDDHELVAEKKNVERNGGILSSTERIIAAMGFCRDREVPQRFKPGIMIMYFDFCEGLEFDYEEIEGFFG